jgi:inhibitor of cysteine peptidase
MTSGNSINNSGQVAGVYTDSKYQLHGFVGSADGKTFAKIDYPGASETSANAINDNGQVAGYFMDSEFNSHGFIATPTGTTYSISGTATSNGSPLSGVSVALGGSSSATTQTASDGTYSFSGLTKGSYTVTPSMSGYTFNPQKATVAITNKDMTESFTATALYSISGTVTLGSSPLSGVTITLSGTAKGSTTTNSDGSYSFTNLQKGSYTVTPSKTGYTFSPPNSTVTLNKNVSGLKFTATALPTYSISGTVTVGNTPVAGVTVTLSGATGTGTPVTTGADGAFSFSGLLKGSYTLTASKTGYTFSRKTVSIVNQSLTNQVLTGRKN